MEGVHGVDVSWLHHSQKGPETPRKDVAPEPPVKDNIPASNTTKQANGTEHHKHLNLHLQNHHHNDKQAELQAQTAAPSKATEKKGPPPPLGRKSSWISSLSSKFSSSSQQSPTTAAPPVQQNETANGNITSTPSTPVSVSASKKDLTSAITGSPKSSPGFLQNALRRLSSSGGGMGKASGHGAIVPRKIMNVDPYRERCSISEVLPAKLRRVSFCVDVEIAGYSAPPEDEDVPPPTPSKVPQNGTKDSNGKKAHEKAKMKDKAEGEALKHPVSAEEVKDSTGSIEATEKTITTTPNPATDKALPKLDEGEKPPGTRKKEKKKRSEEERKERKEKKRQAALANGVIPMELRRDNSSSESPSGASTPKRPQDRPTVDPLRIYRRCCQLRETPPLRKIAEQLAAPGACDELHPGTVTCLYLSGSRFQFSDIVTLGDYLAVVPVRKLILEDCGLTDESVRVILAGLLAVKTAAQARYNKELKRTPGEKAISAEDKMERLGVIEKISLKNNPQIGPDGWRHIACFINMSMTLKAIDLSMIPFPRSIQKEPSTPQPPQQHHHQHHHQQTGNPSSASIDVGTTLEKCLRERRGTRLEELVMAECDLDPEVVVKIVSGVKACGVSRLGLASNALSFESITVIAEYLKSGQCEGLDLGGNQLSEESLNVLKEAFEEAKPKFCALSVADTGLTTASLKVLLPMLAQLPDFRFVDLSHNRELFAGSPNSVGLLRRWLPKMPMLKRVNLNDVAMESEHCISLAEVLPEIPMLAHLSILENPALSALASASDETSREEACALYASLMAATRISKTIVSIDIDVPTTEAGEIVQALAKQLVAYSLRNLERNLAITNDTEYEEKAIHFPGILLHIVGHDEVSGDTESEPAPDDDYIVGGTGVAKALTVCLRNNANHDRRHSSHVTPSGSGTATPTRGTGAEPRSKAMSVNLLANARKIRARLQPAIANEEAAGDEMALRRLRGLDNTLAGLIQRFEDEYPETRLPQRKDDDDATVSETDNPDQQPVLKNPFEGDEDVDAEEDEDLPITEIHPPGRLSRHGSEVNIHSRHLAQEEGNMHRFGQQLRRDILRPQFEDHHWGTTGLEEEPEHIMKLRARLEQLSGDQIKEEIKKNGLENVIKAIGRDAEQLKHLAEADPEAWKSLQTAHGNAYSHENMKGGDVAVED